MKKKNHPSPRSGVWNPIENYLARSTNGRAERDAGFRGWKPGVTHQPGPLTLTQAPVTPCFPLRGVLGYPGSILALLLRCDQSPSIPAWLPVLNTMAYPSSGAISGFLTFVYPPVVMLVSFPGYSAELRPSLAEACDYSLTIMAWFTRNTELYSTWTLVSKWNLTLSCRINSWRC